MGISIEEAVKHIEYLEKFSYVKQDRESFITAIDTMRKYEKIEQILDDCDLEAWEVLEKIKKVVEDGNDIL